MAFKLEVLRGATTYVISDYTDPSNPFSVEGAEGMGGASVRNIEDNGPYQDGTTHLDERLDPRTITLRINVKAASAATLDGNRDTLMKAFKPVKGVPITLKLTRDDGTVRQVDTRRTGPLDIPLVKENRPGNLHRAVVQLRAADPVWYDPTEQNEDFLVPTDWWLAYNTIGSANVLEHVESPSQGQLWTNSGSVAAGSAWTVFFRSGYVAPDGTVTAFGMTSPVVSSIQNAFESDDGYTGGYGVQSRNNIVQGTLMAAGTHDYFVQTNGSNVYLYRDTTLAGSVSNGISDPIPAAGGGTARWRRRADNNRSWPVALPYAAAYNIALSETQRAALSEAATIGSAYSVSVPYLGDVDSYPIIVINGPLANPVITNAATDDVLDFTGGTVGTAEYWTIDLRYGRKSATSSSGSSVTNYLSEDSDLSTFRIVPDPIAAGGTNVFTLSGSALGTAASVSIAYYNRYLSY